MKQNSAISQDVIRPGQAGLLVLAGLQTLMLAALYTKTPPHPPLEIPLFALGPFISASIMLAIVAYKLAGSWAGGVLAVLACTTALISYGPHKWFDAAFSNIWPAVILAQCAVLAVLFELASNFRNRRVSQ